MLGNKQIFKCYNLCLWPQHISIQQALKSGYLSKNHDGLTKSLIIFILSSAPVVVVLNLNHICSATTVVRWASMSSRSCGQHLTNGRYNGSYGRLAGRRNTGEFRNLQSWL